ncbi:hypothetical protein COOONC_10652 [Cooperia oncophora]
MEVIPSEHGSTSRRVVCAVEDGIRKRAFAKAQYLSLRCGTRNQTIWECPRETTSTEHRIAKSTASMDTESATVKTKSTQLRHLLSAVMKEAIRDRNPTIRDRSRRRSAQSIDDDLVGHTREMVVYNTGGKKQGGHAVKIIGWGVEMAAGKYWTIATREIPTGRRMVISA